MSDVLLRCNEGQVPSSIMGRTFVSSKDGRPEQCQCGQGMIDTGTF